MPFARRRIEAMPVSRTAESGPRPPSPTGRGPTQTRLKADEAATIPSGKVTKEGETAKRSFIGSKKEKKTGKKQCCFYSAFVICNPFAPVAKQCACTLGPWRWAALGAVTVGAGVRGGGDGDALPL